MASIISLCCFDLLLYGIKLANILNSFLCCNVCFSYFFALIILHSVKVIEQSYCVTSCCGNKVVVLLHVVATLARRWWQIHSFALRHFFLNLKYFHTENVDLFCRLIHPLQPLFPLWLCLWLVYVHACVRLCLLRGRGWLWAGCLERKRERERERGLKRERKGRERLLTSSNSYLKQQKDWRVFKKREGENIKHRHEGV